MLAALEAGAEDIESTEDGFEIITEPASFMEVKEVLEAEGIEFISAEVDMIPTIYTELHGDVADQFEKMIDALEDDDDVQDIYHNASE